MYAGHLAHVEAALRQSSAHGAGHAPGGQACATAATARHGLEQALAPHVGVALRAEAVQVHRIGHGLLLAQHGLGIANVEREQHLPALEREAVHPRQQAPELGGQLLGQRQQFWRLRRGAQQVGSGHGPGLARHEMQHARARRVGAPGGPGHEEVQPQAEAGFQNAPLRLSGPGGGQAAAAEKGVTRLVYAVVGAAVVTVAEARAEGGSIGEPVDGFGHGVRLSSHHAPRAGMRVKGCCAGSARAFAPRQAGAYSQRCW